MITLNKGEWSELYVLVYLLSTGKLYSADDKLHAIENVYFPILKIIREEINNNEVEFCVDDGKVLVKLNGNKVNELDKKFLEVKAKKIYESILNGDGRTFPVESAESLMPQMSLTRVKASSNDKPDINMEIHDIHTGIDIICGFSVKSFIGGTPTLLNASPSTNFVYKVNGLDKDKMNEINSINSRKKILDRISKILEYGSLEYMYPANDTFKSNLELVDTGMDNIIGAILLDSYSSGITDIMVLINRLSDKNPQKHSNPKVFYAHKMKKLLCSSALSMKPSHEWDGQDEATGGYIIARRDGKVVAYHLYNRNSFEKYLLENTVLERGSTTKHHFGTIYQVDDEMYFNLNLQVRFKKIGE